MSDLHEAIRRRYLATHRVSRVPHRFSDVLVIGSGAAGLSAALAASHRPDAEVTLLSKAPLRECATHYAQGGIAAVLDPEAAEDSTEMHVQDTLEVAAGLADEDTVRTVVTEGVERVRELIDLGAEFDRDEHGSLHFTREGGHSAPRILHRGDSTGQEIERILLAAVRERRNVLPLENAFVVDLLTRDRRCLGALLARPDGQLEAVWARTTILATGGAGRLFRETTNPPVCTGDGLAMTFRAGATLQDLEFIQFHPTTLYIAGAERFLITEAARGEGGVLRDAQGNRFMSRFHPLEELAPRDVVSRAILTVMKSQNTNRVWLDLTGIGAARVRARFPRILEFCSSFGIDILREPIPVRPSAHYTIGGVRSGLRGETDVEGLLVAGEVASTRLHGANRLASNSLLESLVFGHRAGQLAVERIADVPVPEPFSTHDPREGPEERASLARANREVIEEDLRTSLKSLLWYRVGAERTGDGLRHALAQLRSWLPYGLGASFFTPERWSLQNMLQTALLVTISALERTESRGVHFRSDHPERDDDRWSHHSTVSRYSLRFPDG